MSPRIAGLAIAFASMTLCGAYPPPTGLELTLGAGFGEHREQLNNHPSGAICIGPSGTALCEGALYNYDATDRLGYALARYRTENGLTVSLELPVSRAHLRVDGEKVNASSDTRSPSYAGEDIWAGALAARVGMHGAHAGIEGGLAIARLRIRDESPGALLSAEGWAGWPGVVHAWGQFGAGPWVPVGVGLGHVSKYLRLSAGVSTGFGHNALAMWLGSAMGRLGPLPVWLGLDARGGRNAWQGQALASLELGPVGGSAASAPPPRERHGDGDALAAGPAVTALGEASPPASDSLDPALAEALTQVVPGMRVRVEHGGRVTEGTFVRLEAGVLTVRASGVSQRISGAEVTALAAQLTTPRLGPSRRPLTVSVGGAAGLTLWALAGMGDDGYSAPVTLPFLIACGVAFGWLLGSPTPETGTAIVWTPLYEVRTAP